MQDFSVRPKRYNDGIFAILFREEAVGTMDNTVVHLDRCIPDDPHPESVLHPAGVKCPFHVISPSSFDTFCR
jgi:hypothetical protein